MWLAECSHGKRKALDSGPVLSMIFFLRDENNENKSFYRC